MVQDRRGEVHDRRQENAAVDENVGQAKGGKHYAFFSSLRFLENIEILELENNI